MNKLKVGCLTYTLIGLDPKDATIKQRYGECDHFKQEIRTDTSLTKERKKEVLIHEILHAIWGQWVNTQKDLEEEDIVMAFGHGLATVFKDNPELKKELF